MKQPTDRPTNQPTNQNDLTTHGNTNPLRMQHAQSLPETISSNIPGQYSMLHLHIRSSILPAQLKILPVMIRQICGGEIRVCEPPQETCGKGWVTFSDLLSQQMQHISDAAAACLCLRRAEQQALQFVMAAPHLILEIFPFQYARRKTLRKERHELQQDISCCVPETILGISNVFHD